MNLTSRTRAVLAVVASVALLAGCGGGGDAASDAKAQTINLVGFAVPEAAN